MDDCRINLDLIVKKVHLILSSQFLKKFEYLQINYITQKVAVKNDDGEVQCRKPPRSYTPISNPQRSKDKESLVKSNIQSQAEAKPRHRGNDDMTPVKQKETKKQTSQNKL